MKRECVTPHEISFLLSNDLNSTPRAAIDEQMHPSIPSGSSSLNAFDTLPDISNVDLVNTFNNSFELSTLGVFEEVHGSNGWADQPDYMSESVNQVIA